MQNSNFNSNIELGSRSNRPNPPPSDLPNYNYLPQDEDQELQSPSNQPQRGYLEGKLEACVHKVFSTDKDKAIKIAVTLILLLLIVDFWPLFALMPYIDLYRPYTSDIRGALDFMSLNLKTDPILDIKIIDKGKTCPNGFEPLKLGVWPGTKEGYLCGNRGPYRFTCKEIDFNEPQKEIPGTLPIELEEWNSSVWCGKRAVLGTDYIKKADCPLGYKECYAGGCFLGDCPITQVEMTPSQSNLLLKRIPGEFPLINIHISPNDIPCFNHDGDARPINISSYNLLARRAYGCDKYGLDSQFSAKLDVKSILDAFSQNAFKYSTANLPYFEDQSKISLAVISSRTRMRTIKHDHCLKLDERLIRDSAKAFDKSAPLLTMTVNALMIRFMLFPFVAIMRCCMTKKDFWGGLAYTSKKLLGFIFTWNSQLLFVIYRIIHSYQVLREAREYFEKYDSLGCFGEGQGSVVVGDYLEILRQGEMNCWLYFGLIGSFSLSVLISFWYLMVKNMSSERLLRHI